MSRVEAIVSDFGGVLTTPLLDAFLGLQERRGIPLEAFGAAIARAAADNGGANPLFELETGRLTEARFVAQLGDALTRGAGPRRRPRAASARRYFEHLHPNDELFAFMRQLHGRGYRMAILHEQRARVGAAVALDAADRRDVRAGRRLRLRRACASPTRASTR